METDDGKIVLERAVGTKEGTEVLCVFDGSFETAMLKNGYTVNGSKRTGSPEIAELMHSLYGL